MYVEHWKACAYARPFVYLSVMRSLNTTPSLQAMLKFVTILKKRLSNVAIENMMGESTVSR